MFEIRYKAIEFDGWKLRRWTNRFNGERFSLVCFTPEIKSRKYSSNYTVAVPCTDLFSP
jgi:hypothetical protein